MPICTADTTHLSVVALDFCIGFITVLLEISGYPNRQCKLHTDRSGPIL